jgi:DUF971 family protein
MAAVQLGYDLAWTNIIACLVMTQPQPTEIVLHQGSRVLEVTFSDGRAFRLPCEFLRVYSPSAEVRGHGPGQEVLQTGKENVNINAIEPVGAYGVRLVFTDGHDTGLYSWEYLRELGLNQERLWQDYLARLAKAGATRTDSAAAPAAVPRKSWKNL